MTPHPQLKRLILLGISNFQFGLGTDFWLNTGKIKTSNLVWGGGNKTDFANNFKKPFDFA